MVTSIDDIEAWDGECVGIGVASNIRIMLPKGDSLGGSSSLGGGKRNCGGRGLPKTRIKKKQNFV
jgi:hypothetical protein